MLLAFGNPSTRVAFQTCLGRQRQPPPPADLSPKSQETGLCDTSGVSVPMGEMASHCPSAQQCRGLSRLTGLRAPRQQCQRRSLRLGTGTTSSWHEAEPLHPGQLLLLHGGAWDPAATCMPWQHRSPLPAHLLAPVSLGRGTCALKKNNLLFAKSTEGTNPG